MSTKEMRVWVTRTTETTRVGRFDLDLDEFNEWCAGYGGNGVQGYKEPYHQHSNLIRLFIESSRDCEEIKDAIYAMGVDVGYDDSAPDHIERAEVAR